jgi:site-specific DNA-methyltransferase (adenine-specific)
VPCDRKIGPYACCSVVEGDCLELMKALPDGCVDAVITDPPYGVSGIQNSKTKGSPKKNDYDGFTDSVEYIQESIIPRIKCALFLCSRAIITPGNRCLTLYPMPDSFGCFYQPASVGLQSWGRADSQPILYYGKYPHDSHEIPGQRCSFTLTEAPEQNGHPCPKPESIWTAIVRSASLEGETILDPFLGSGTTAVAAVKLGRHFLGFEISGEYCRIARDRISRTEAQPNLFAPQAEQMKLPTA